MMEPQLSPLSLYFHGNKQEWRARYAELDCKKAKHFSCKRYGANRAYFLATLYLRVIRDRRNVMPNEDVAFWHNVVKDFKSLDDAPQKVLPKPPTRTANMSMGIEALRKTLPEMKQKCRFLDDGNIELFNRAVRDIEAKSYVATAPFELPTLCTTSIKNEAANLSNFLRRYRIDIETCRPSDADENASPTKHRLAASQQDPAELVHELFETLIEREANKFKKPKKMSREELMRAERTAKKERRDDDRRKRDPAVEDLIALIRISRSTRDDALRMLNRFILRSRNAERAYDFLTASSVPELSAADVRRAETDESDSSEDRELADFAELGEDEERNYARLCARNEEIIERMAADFEGERYYRPKVGGFAGDFGDPEGSEDADMELDGAADELEDLTAIGAGSLYSQCAPAPAPKVSAATAQPAKEPAPEDDRAERAVELNRICNEKLASLIEQTADVPDAELREVIYECLEEESRLSSDLGSLMRISARLGEPEPEPLCRANRLYHLSGQYAEGYTDVVYKNNKIIPSASTQFCAKAKSERAKLADRIALSGSEKLDVNLDALERIFSRNYNQDELVRTVMENLERIDAKLLRIVQEYEGMHRALHEFAKERPPAGATNDLEEAANLETLHVVAETLMDTKLKLIQQVHAYFDAQVALLEGAIPRRYCRALAQILYHNPKEF